MQIGQINNSDNNTAMLVTENNRTYYNIAPLLSIFLSFSMGCRDNNTATVRSDEQDAVVEVIAMQNDTQTPSTPQVTTTVIPGCMQRDTVVLISSKGMANIVGLSDGDSVVLRYLTQAYQQYQDGQEVGDDFATPQASESKWIKDHLSSFYDCYAGSDDADDAIAFREAMLDIVAKSIDNGFIHSSIANDLFCSHSPSAGDIVRYNTRIISTECWSVYIDSIKSRGENDRFMLAEMYILGDTLVHKESLDDIAEYLQASDYAISKFALDSFRREQPNSYEILSFLLN